MFVCLFVCLFPCLLYWLLVCVVACLLACLVAYVLACLCACFGACLCLLDQFFVQMLKSIFLYINWPHMQRIYAIQHTTNLCLPRKLDQRHINQVQHVVGGTIAERTRSERRGPRGQTEHTTELTPVRLEEQHNCAQTQ